MYACSLGFQNYSLKITILKKDLRKTNKKQANKRTIGHLFFNWKYQPIEQARWKYSEYHTSFRPELGLPEHMNS